MRKIYLKIISGLLAVLFAISVSAQEKTNDFKEYRPLITKNASELGLTTADANDAIITHAYTDPATNITFVYLQQAYQQIKVYKTIITVTFRDGSLLYHSGSFVNNIAGKAGDAIPVKSYTDAVRAAAQHLQLPIPEQLSTVEDAFSTQKKYTVTPAGIARKNIDITLCWTSSDDKQQLTLTWNVNIDELRSADWWNVRIDAITGEYVQKDNWTVNEHTEEMLPKQMTPLPIGQMPQVQDKTQPKQLTRLSKKQSASQIVLRAPPPNVASATYRVIPYPLESPIHGAFSNEISPWLLAGAGNNATTIGWHFDSTNNYSITRGNNVFAFLDRINNNTADAARNWPDTSQTPAPSLSFVHNINTAQQPFQDTENKKAALDNLFYWNNLIHDVTYQYGFTEAAGNFQANNLGRGGAQNDFVTAHALDSAGYNNANFSTPTDGTSGRMQMYTWSTAPLFTINSPQSIAGSYASRENSFTAPNKLIDRGPKTGLVALYNDDSAGLVHNACATTVAINAADLSGKIVLIDASTCTFISKVKKAQNAGAIAVMLYSANILGLGGTDATVTIPTVSITTLVANSIITQLKDNIPVSATLASGIYLDGDLDNGIIAHEYGHGISNRLTGGPYGSGCLGNAEQAGEGWSDYIGLMLTTNWATTSLADSTKLRPIGTYANNQTPTGSGIRAYPYTTSITANPLTYTNVSATAGVHANGTVWCSALWNMTWNIIRQQGAITADMYNSAGNGGNVVAMNLVMMGLKLQPCSPGFLDSRNAILAADSILYNNAHKCAIWNAFARRGMGFSAVQGLSTNAGDQTAAFDLPSGIQIAKPLPLIVSATAQTSITHTATCNCQPVTGITIQDTIPAGFTYVSSTPAGTLTNNVLTFPATDFTAVQSKNFTIVLQAPADGCTIDSVINDNRETTITGGFASSGTPAWTTSTLKAHTPASSWFVPNQTARNSSFLTSANTGNTILKNLSILSFWHYYKTETKFDGGVVEYSTDGITWNDAGPLFIFNSYNSTMDTSTVLRNRTAFSGNSSGFSPSLLNLSSFGATPVAFRFRMENDAGTGVEGWYVDDITRANGCGGFLKTGIYNSASVRQDTLLMPLFVTPKALPLTLLWFYANPLGGQVALDWKTVSETGVKNFTVEWSRNGTDWTTIASVNATNRNSNNYSTIHTTPVAGTNYYRIRMNDIDGKFTYSTTRIIKVSDKANPMLVLVPNPVNSDATLYISRTLKVRSVKVYDAAGSLVRQIVVGAGVQQLRINTATLAAGIYTLETVGGERQVTRMLVQH